MSDDNGKQAVPSRQEMFDLAVRGLRSQGFRRAVTRDGACNYLTSDGLRCAWGWVDTPLRGQPGTVLTLAEKGIGLAGKLSAEDRWWARELQRCHDDAPDGCLEAELRKFCKRHGLEWPEE